jgi:hypothetical protein
MLIRKIYLFAADFGFVTLLSLGRRVELRRLLLTRCSRGLRLCLAAVLLVAAGKFLLA